MRGWRRAAAPAGLGGPVGQHASRHPAAAHGDARRRRDACAGWRLPLMLGFLAGRHGWSGRIALGWVEDTETTATLGEFGVVFLLFTLGPRVLAAAHDRDARRGVRARRRCRSFVTRRPSPPRSRWCPRRSRRRSPIVLGGAVAMSSTAIVMQPARPAGRAQPDPRPARLRRAAVPGPRVRALPGARGRARRRRRGILLRERGRASRSARRPLALADRARGRALAACGRCSTRSPRATPRSCSPFAVLFVAIGGRLGDARGRAVASRSARSSPA
jgi:hypothetical protein